MAKTDSIRFVKTLGLWLFLIALTAFTSLWFVGSYRLTDEIIDSTLSTQENNEIGNQLKQELAGREFHSSYSLGREIIAIYEAKNQLNRDSKNWDRVMHAPPKEFALKLTRVAAFGWVVEHKFLLFLLIFGFGSVGALFYILAELRLHPVPGIRNDAIFQSASTNRGWVGIITFLYLVSFYVVLYFHPYILVNAISLLDPLKQLYAPSDSASQWFLYGFLYCLVMIVMGIRMLVKYRNNAYQRVRTIVVVFFQLIFAFLLIEILPLFGLPARDLKNAWPLDYTFLYDWNVSELWNAGHFGKFLFVWGILLSVVLIPILVYFFGKRWYCSWVCGCGGLAETLGDPYRQLSSKKLWVWKFERWIIHAVLIFAIILTFFAGFHTYHALNYPNEAGNDILFGISAYSIRDWYGFLIGSIFAGVIGTGFYPIFGNRTWCRFGCPLAAYMGLVQRFKSRFRITTNGGQCISCGNCSTYCEQGIDVRSYAQKGQNVVRASCVGCGICAAVCPRGVLKLENGPEEGRFGNEGPIVFGHDGFKLNQDLN